MLASPVGRLAILAPAGPLLQVLEHTDGVGLEQRYLVHVAKSVLGHSQALSIDLLVQRSPTEWLGVFGVERLVLGFGSPYRADLHQRPARSQGPVSLTIKGKEEFSQGLQY